MFSVGFNEDWVGDIGGASTPFPVNTYPIELNLKSSTIILQVFIRCKLRKREFEQPGIEPGSLDDMSSVLPLYYHSARLLQFAYINSQVLIVLHSALLLNF